MLRKINNRNVQDVKTVTRLHLYSINLPRNITLDALVLKHYSKLNEKSDNTTQKFDET